MIACQCLAVSDRVILEAVAAGALSIDAIGQACQAGTDCGGCHRTLRHMIDAAAAVDTVFQGSRGFQGNRGFDAAPLAVEVSIRR